MPQAFSGEYIYRRSVELCFYCLDTLGKVGAIEFQRWAIGSYAVKALASSPVTIPGLKKVWDWMEVLVQSICVGSWLPYG